jgi:curved DNA-binding protein CbpA
MVDYYQVLGIRNTASVKEIKAAYKRLARLRHPDLNGGSPETAQAFVQISRARDILIDPRRRAEYDAQRNAHAAKDACAPVVNPTVETYMRRARSEARIRKNLENFLTAEREEARALRQAVFPIVAFLFAAFFVPLVRPHFWRSSGWIGRSVILTLVSIGAWHTVSKIWTAIKLHTDDDRTGATVRDEQILATGWSRRQAFLFIGLAAIGLGLLGTLIGMSLSDSLLIAMPMFFDPSIRLELLLYPWIMVLLIDACQSLSQRLDI